MKTKKIIAYIMAMLCVASVSGCGEKEVAEENSTITEITTEAETTATTIIETTTTKLTTTTINIPKLDDKAIVEEVSFLVSPNWTCTIDSQDIYASGSWYSDDGGNLNLFIYKDFEVFGISDIQSFYEDTKSNENYHKFSEIEDVKIDDCDAKVFDFVEKNSNNKFKDILILRNDRLILMTIQMTVDKKPSEISYCVDDIIKSISFGEIPVQTTIASTEPTEPPTTEAPKEEITFGMKNALSSAKSYLKYMAFSYTGLIEQLEYEDFSHEEAVYGADNCGADWKKQAAKKAQEYIDYTSFSRQGLIDQLLYEGFTQEQAEYGVQAVGY